jgi:hypothetical protein
MRRRSAQPVTAFLRELQQLSDELDDNDRDLVLDLARRLASRI